MNNLSKLVDAAVEHSGLTRRALAERAGLAPETVSRICGRGTGDFGTVEKLMKAAGLGLVAGEGAGVRETAPAYGHTRLDQRSLALHAVIAGRLFANPGLVESTVLPTIERFKRVHAGTGSLQLLEAWEEAARSGVSAVAALCVDPSERGQQLRQASPLTGVLLRHELKCVNEAFSA